jgi:hypothetical protein
MLAGALMFLSFACGSFYLSITSGEIWSTTIIFVLGFFYAVGLLLTRGPMQIDETVIEMRTPLGHYRMRWDEAESIVIGASDLWIVGRDKHLALVAPNFWFGPGKAEAQRILGEKAGHVAHKKPTFILPWPTNCKTG